MSWLLWCRTCGLVFDFTDYDIELLSSACFKDMVTVDVVSIFVAVVVVDFKLLWNPSHSYDWHWTNWTRKSRYCLLPRCKELLVLGLCCVDGWFIHQIADLCLIRINHRRYHMWGFKCL